jgi:hypothetical protein
MAPYTHTRRVVPAYDASLPHLGRMWLGVTAGGLLDADQAAHGGHEARPRGCWALWGDARAAFDRAGCVQRAHWKGKGMSESLKCKSASDAFSRACTLLQNDD